MKSISFSLGAFLVGAALLTGCATEPGAAPAEPSQSTETTRQTESKPPAPKPQPTADLGQSCLARAQAMSLEEKAGQLLMVGVQAGTPTEQAIADLQTIQAGSALLLGDRYDVSAVAAETGAYSDAVPGLLIAVDQEGGMVQRLQGEGFDQIPPAAEQGQTPSEQLTADWARYGQQIRDAGVHYDLAPVADVVPADQVEVNEPVGKLQRGYSSDPVVAAEKNAAVIEGLKQANVASSVKHFPGLGYVPQNTDFAVGHDQVSTLTDEQLAPFQAAIDAGASSVMVSSAIYTQVDPENPAVFSSLIIEDILRSRMGYDGVVISDDLGVAKSVTEVPAEQRATRFYQAGGDLLISADPAAANQMAAATVANAQADPQFAESLDAKVTRVLLLKVELGVASCD